jgi:hypothetical protein
LFPAYFAQPGYDDMLREFKLDSESLAMPRFPICRSNSDQDVTEAIIRERDRSPQSRRTLEPVQSASARRHRLIDRNVHAD